MPRWMLFAFCFASIGTLVSCKTSPEAQLLDSAAEAMGGAGTLLAVRTLTIEGEGSSFLLGQNRTIHDDLPVWKVTGYRRSIDLANLRTRVEQTRTAQFLFAGATVQHLNQALDGNVAFNLSETGEASRASTDAARDRRVELLHHPLTALRLALEKGASAGSLRVKKGLHTIDINGAHGDTFTLSFDDSTHLPHSVLTNADQPNLGDVVLETVFEDYQPAGPVKLPMRLKTTIGSDPQFDLKVTRNLVDAPVENLIASEAIRSAAPPVTPAPVVTVVPVAKGIWWLAGSGNHRSILFEFADHLTLFEVPLNEARSKAVIDKARTVVPGKPLTEAIVSHHHFDHSGGLRVAVAEGLTIITYKDNIPFFKDLIARPHTIVPDELAQGPRNAKFVPVDDEMTLKDSTMEVRLYHTLDNPREGTNLFAFVPRDGILVQADLYDSTWLQHPWGPNVAHNMAVRHLQPRKDVPVHGEIEPYEQVLKTISLARKPGQ